MASRVMGARSVIATGINPLTALAQNRRHDLSADPGNMADKFTIMLDLNLHLSFKIEAIYQGRTISELVSEAMEAYKDANFGHRDARNSASRAITLQSAELSSDAKSSSSSQKTPREAVDTKHTSKKPYQRKFYKPGTRELNGTARAKEIRVVAKRIKSLLLDAANHRIEPKDLHSILEKEGFDEELRKATLGYLRLNGIIDRKKSEWVLLARDAASDPSRSRNSA